MVGRWVAMFLKQRRVSTTRTSWPRSLAASTRRLVEYSFGPRERMAMRMMDISGRNPGLALQKGTRRINQRVVFHGGTAKQHAVAHFVAVGQREIGRASCRERG